MIALVDLIFNPKEVMMNKRTKRELVIIACFFIKLRNFIYFIVSH